MKKLLLILTTLFISFQITAQLEDHFVTTWDTTLPGTSNNTSIFIPVYQINETTPPTGYNYDVDWDNDGLFDEFGITGSVSHDFGAPGTYTIRIKGDFPSIYFRNGKFGNNTLNPNDDKEKIMRIDQWGAIEWASMHMAFFGCSNLNGPISDNPDLSSVSSLSSMFNSAVLFDQPINDWDVSTVTNMSNMFVHASSFNQPLDNWDVSNVTNMKSMFSGASSFNQPLDNWDVSNVTNMSSMFSKASSFNQPLDNWDVSNVINMIKMFWHADSFDQPINNWNVSQVTNMFAIFSQASSFNQSINNWDVSSITNMGLMFHGASSFNQPLNNWDVSNVCDMSSMFYNAESFNQPLNNWDVSNVTNMIQLFFHADSFNQPLNNWDVSNVTNMQSVFGSASSFNQPLDNWDVSSVTSMLQIFHSAFSFDQPLNSWDVSNVTNMTSMFYNASLSAENYDATLIAWNNLNLQPNIIFNGGNSKYCEAATARQNMIDNDGWTFYDGGADCEGLYFISTWQTDNPGTSNSTSIEIPTYTGETYLYDVDWDNDNIFDDIGVTGNITHDYGVAGPQTIQIKGIFPRIFFDNSGDKEKFTSINQWGPIEWSSMNGAFHGCSNLEVNAADSPDLSLVQDMSRMFEDASSLNQDIGDWDVSQVTNMEKLFEGATLFNQNIENWDVGMVQNMSSLFKDAENFNQPLISWNVENVNEMENMFKNALAFDQSLDFWKTGNVLTMEGMFEGAASFNSAINGNEIPGSWDVSQVQTMRDMFREASSFNQYVGGWDVSSVTNMISMFNNATSFDQNLGNWDISNVTTMANMFLDVTLSTPNYDALLIGWEALPMDESPFFFAGNSQYCDGAAARQNLVDNEGWIIVDGGSNVSCLTEDSDHFVTTWDTTLPGTSNSTSITIPAFAGETYNYEVDWENNDVWETGFTGSASHDYGVGNEGIYTVRIRGDFPRIYFNASGPTGDFGDEQKIISIDQWGTQQWTSMQNAFTGCSNVQGQDTLDIPDFSALTNLSGMFFKATSFNHDINDWDVSTVTNMSKMFQQATAFNQNIDGWDVSSVTDMSFMFNLATNFNQALISWPVYNVEDMSFMFKGAAAFNQSLDSWQTVSVLTMQSMFEDASAFNGAIDGNSVPGSWNLSSVNTMVRMFKNSTSFNQNIGNWNVSGVSNMNSMFQGAIAFDQNLGGWDISQVSNMNNMFQGATLSTDNYDALLTGWDAINMNLVTFHGGNSQYCQSFYNRLNMSINDLWSITDGGEDPSCEFDTDGDGVPDDDDNCVSFLNPLQEDLDGDGDGDICDTDIDGDGELNNDDCEPYDETIYTGAPCDDFDPQTENDVYTSDCFCEGTLIEILGCTDPIACNYDPTATIDDGSCNLPDGCADSAACNYDPTATCDDGSCTYPPGDANADGVVDVLDLVAISSNFGCMEDCLGLGDANFDGQVNILDLVEVSSNMGNVCP